MQASLRLPKTRESGSSGRCILPLTWWRSCDTCCDALCQLIATIEPVGGWESLSPELQTEKTSWWPSSTTRRKWCRYAVFILWSAGLLQHNIHLHCSSFVIEAKQMICRCYTGLWHTMFSPFSDMLFLNCCVGCYIVIIKVTSCSPSFKKKFSQCYYKISFKISDITAFMCWEYYLAAVCLIWFKAIRKSPAVKELYFHLQLLIRRCFLLFLFQIRRVSAVPTSQCTVASFLPHCKE